MNDYSTYERHGMRRRHPRGGGDKRIIGFIVLMVGAFLLLRKFDLFYFNLRDMWPWVLIVIGLLIGIKSKFKSAASWILITIGALHLIPAFTIFGVRSSALAGPIALIVIGIIIMLKPSKKKSRSRECNGHTRSVTNSDSVINIDVTFGGHKEIVTSKHFKGGYVSTTFGGTEVNLMNASTPDKIVELHVNVSFGGVELTIPSNWDVQNEMKTTLGGLEDNRNIHTSDSNIEKTILVLKGSCSFGSVEIKSF